MTRRGLLGGVGLLLLVVGVWFTYCGGRDLLVLRSYRTSPPPTVLTAAEDFKRNPYWLELFSKANLGIGLPALAGGCALLWASRRRRSV